MPFILKAVVDALEGLPGAERQHRRRQHRLPQGRQPRRGGGARLGPHRPRHPPRRREERARPRARASTTSPSAPAPRSSRSRRSRAAPSRSRTPASSAASSARRSSTSRRSRSWASARSRSGRSCATTRSRSAPWPTSRSPSTTASWTAPTPTASWPRSRRRLQEFDEVGLVRPLEVRQARPRARTRAGWSSRRGSSPSGRRAASRTSCCCSSTTPCSRSGATRARENVLLPAEALRERGFEVFETGRGGDVTYHGPGQVVGYPILDLAPDRRDVHRYVRDLEEVMIRTCADYGLQAVARRRASPGAWVGDEKIGAIGVRIARWVTSHGFAFNVATDLVGLRPDRPLRHPRARRHQPRAPARAGPCRSTRSWTASSAHFARRLRRARSGTQAPS